MFRDTVKFLLEDTEEYKNELYEGIVIAKNSNKIRTLINRIKKTTKDEDLNEFINELEKIEKDFRKLENEYKNDKKNRNVIKQSYKELVKHYHELLSIVDKENVVKALQGSGLAILIAAALTLGYFGVVTNGSIANDAIMGKDGNVLEKGFEGSKELAAKILRKEKVINFADKATKLAQGSKEELAKDSFLDAFGRKKALTLSMEKSAQVSTLLNTAGVMNGALYGTGVATTAGIIGLFKKLSDMILNKNKLYYRTKGVLDKIKKIESK